MAYPDPLKFWCQSIIPLVYDQSLSVYELLGKVIEYLNRMLQDQQTLSALVITHGQQILQLQKDVNILYSEIDKIKNGEYIGEYIQGLACWIDKNLQCLVARIAKFVTFGLTLDGHFVVYIPSNWDFLEFDTCVNPDSPNYGRLAISF